MESAVAPRNELGQLLPGSVIGPNGRRGGPRVRMNRLLDAQLATALEKNEAFSVAEFVKKVVDALEDPTKDAASFALAKLACDRIWPAINLHEHRDADVESEEAGADRWSRLAAEHDTRRSRAEALTVEPVVGRQRDDGQGSEGTP